MIHKKDKALFLEKLIAELPGHIYWKDKNSVLQGCNNEQAHFMVLKKPA